MVLDYSERRTVSKNRPKKQPMNFVGILVFGAVVFSFAGGVFTGWLVFRPGKAPLPPPATRQGAAPPPASEGGKPHVQAPRGLDAPLTFYETLSKGNSNTLIGSGINPKKAHDSAPPHPAPSAPAEVPTPAKPATSSPSAEHASSEKKSAPPSAPVVQKEGAPKKTVPDIHEPAKTGAAKPGGYTVQVASYRDRKEAEAIAARIVEKGLAAYIVETRVPDRGTWYRVRIGKHLSQQAATELAGRAGKGAVPVAE